MPRCSGWRSKKRSTTARRPSLPAVVSAVAAAVPLVLDAAARSPRAVITEFGQALPAVWARGNRRTAPARPAVAAVA